MRSIDFHQMPRAEILISRRIGSSWNRQLGQAVGTMMDALARFPQAIALAAGQGSRSARAELTRLIVMRPGGGGSAGSGQSTRFPPDASTLTAPLGMAVPR
jgi:hypothetical protein